VHFSAFLPFISVLFKRFRPPAQWPSYTILLQAFFLALRPAYCQYHSALFFFSYLFSHPFEAETRRSTARQRDMIPSTSPPQPLPASRLPENSAFFDLWIFTLLNLNHPFYFKPLSSMSVPRRLLHFGIIHSLFQVASFVTLFQTRIFEPYPHRCSPVHIKMWTIVLDYRSKPSLFVTLSLGYLHCRFNCG